MLDPDGFARLTLLRSDSFGSRALQVKGKGFDPEAAPRYTRLIGELLKRLRPDHQFLDEDIEFLRNPPKGAKPQQRSALSE